MGEPTDPAPGHGRSSVAPSPARRYRRVAAAAGVAALVVVGVILLVLGLNGAGAPRSAAPVAARDNRPPVTVPATPTPMATTPTTPMDLPWSPPRRIDVPAIDVHSTVNPIGLNPDGTVGVPTPGPLYDQAAWYTGSATPGRTGPSVILGHIDSAANGPSVFYRLSQLQPLDEFTVTRADGRTITYKINSVRQYPKDAFPTQEVYGPTTRPEMRLITCGGQFDSRERSYLDNTVVYANQIDPPDAR